MKFNDLDTVVLDHDVSRHNLREGDIGTIVHSYKNGKTFEIEFVNADGRTVALLTLDKNDIRPFTKNEILHVRDVSGSQHQASAVAHELKFKKN